MIREFFAPRMALFFFAFTALVWLGLHLWLKASKKTHRRWLRGVRVPFTAGIVSLAMCAGLAFLVQFLN